MGSGGQEVRPSPCKIAWNVGKLATAAEAAAGTNVLVATDAVAVAGVEEARLSLRVPQRRARRRWML
eukprot:5692695-Pleurochrysis_carterae.AAC.1